MSDKFFKRAKPYGRQKFIGRAHLEDMFGKNIRIIPLILLSIAVFPAIARADVPAIEVSPLVIEEQSKIRDILEYEIKIKNNTKPYKASIYPTVSDITTIDGKQQFLDFATTLNKGEYLSRWMSFSRGVIDLMPGEEKTLKLTINVDPNAKPGNYKAALIFPEGPNRYEAEENAKTTFQPQTLVNITIKDNIVERAEVSLYQPLKDVFISLPAKIELDIKNIGNAAVVPKGSIYIYDRRGQEVGQLDINPQDRAIDAEKRENFSQEWNPDSAFGRYKAKLEVEYGQGDKRDLADTVYFWVLPKKILYIFGFMLALLAITLIAMNYRRKQMLHLSIESGPNVVPAGRQEQPGVLNLKRK